METIKAMIVEVEYSCSPGGEDCWELRINHFATSENYTDFKTAGEAMNKLISLYPDNYLDVQVYTLDASNKFFYELNTVEQTRRI